jgi:hypothetical protein
VVSLWCLAVQVCPVLFGVFNVVWVKVFGGLIVCFQRACFFFRLFLLCLIISVCAVEWLGLLHVGVPLLFGIDLFCGLCTHNFLEPVRTPSLWKEMIPRPL